MGARLGSLVVVMALTASAAADLRVAIGNDVFSEAAPPFDDDGFTHDLDLRFWRPYRGYLVGGRIYDRWITERPRTAGRRRDLLELLATAERTWGTVPRSVVLAARAGPTFTGNLGGRWGQNAFHVVCRCGATLDEGLQDRYEGGADAGATFGVGARGQLGTMVAQGYAGVDAQLAVGTGVSWLDATTGLRVVGRRGTTQVGAHAELAMTRYVVDDQRLAFGGAYRRGWQGAYRVGVHVAWHRYRIEYQYRANESGSGEPIGVVAFTIKQAGTAF